MRGWGLVSFPSSGRGLVVFPLSISKSRTSQRCPRNCSGVFAVTFLEGAQGLLSRFVRVYPVFRLHHSRGRRGCSVGLVVASLEETQGLLSRFDSCVFRLHHSRGRRRCSGGLPWAYRPGASFSLHVPVPASRCSHMNRITALRGFQVSIAAVPVVSHVVSEKDLQNLTFLLRFKSFV